MKEKEMNAKYEDVSEQVMDYTSWFPPLLLLAGVTGAGFLVWYRLSPQV